MGDVLLVEVETYLPDDLLVKVDIASMAHSLEVRAPFLDQDLAEFVARLPTSMKLRGGTGKIVLRGAVGDLLPESILARRKMGFGVPINAWFRGELLPLLRDTLLGPTLARRGWFEPGSVKRLLDEHASGRADHAYRLWALRMLELWLQRFIDHRPPVQRGRRDLGVEVGVARDHALPGERLRGTGSSGGSHLETQSSVTGEATQRHRQGGGIARFHQQAGGSLDDLLGNSPTRVATTGRPVAIACRIELGKPSWRDAWSTISEASRIISMSVQVRLLGTAAGQEEPRSRRGPPQRGVCVEHVAMALVVTEVGDGRNDEILRLQVQRRSSW